MKRSLIFLALTGCSVFDCAEWTSKDPGPAPKAAGVLEISAAQLEDKIRGGLLGQLFGNLNGLPHEFKYIEEPGTVDRYVPGLPEGAFTDDDTDIEWVYVSAMARTGRLELFRSDVADLWRRNMNDRLWCANLYARQLMDLGLEPPLTGLQALNPWASFNISAQFVSEAFGLVAPGQPYTAARLGVHYTQAAVDGEPLQTTQFFAGMIATAFAEPEILKIVDAGRRMLDPKSVVGPIVDDVLGWWKENPGDWKTTRRKIKEKYTKHGGTMRDRNGYELNTAAIVGALLHGNGEFVETLRLAFNFGWDSDCNAATCGTILGVIKGKRWMDAQGWVVKDVYRNTCRPGMPKDETITRYGDKLIAVARRVLLVNEATEKNGMFRIPREAPGVFARLPAPGEQEAQLRRLFFGSPEERRREAMFLVPQDPSGFIPEREPIARAEAAGKAAPAYAALCLGEAERFAKEDPKAWAEAVEALKSFPNVIREIYNAPHPSGSAIQAAAKSAGIEPPPKSK